MSKVSVALLLVSVIVSAVTCAGAERAADKRDDASATPAVDFERRPARPLTTTAEALAIVAAADRSDEDRALDAARRPAEVLTFAGVSNGMKVGEIMAGGGYTAELLARAVGEGGVVYAQNNTWILERFAQKPWTERLQKPAMKKVVRVDRELDDPLPADATELDVVVMSLFYHDSVWMGADRAKMNAAIFAALRKGGAYVVIDHSAVPGHGIADAQTLHRIDEAAVIAEVTAAGFTLAPGAAGRADFLRNPEDDRDWNDSPRAAAERRGTSDRFALRFLKP